MATELMEAMATRPLVADTQGNPGGVVTMWLPTCAVLGFDLLTGERVELTNPPVPLNGKCPKT